MTINLLYTFAIFSLVYLFVLLQQISHISNYDKTISPIVPKSNIFFFNERVMYATPDVSIVGTLFVAHACTHSAIDFWTTSSNCPYCIGLSEEVLIVDIALRMGYIVVAINSTNRKERCWGQSSLDTTYVAKMIEYIQIKNDVKNKPTFAIGTSSGGSFVFSMICRGEIDGAIIQVMGVNPECYFRQNVKSVPIVLNPMPRDVGTNRHMLTNYNQLINYNNQLVQLIPCDPVPVTAEYLAGRLPLLSIELIHLIIKSLILSGNINRTEDENKQFLIKDPTDPSNDWRNELLHSIPPLLMQQVNLERGRSPLAKSLHRAWAFHEYCADYIQSSLEWMNSVHVQRLSHTSVSAR